MHGLSLVEILAVVGILAVLMAIALPIIATGIHSGRKAVAISNLRQCSQGILLYSNDNDGLLPSRETAFSLLGTEITFDPGDYWRSSSKEDLGYPMLGSFGYAPSLVVVDKLSRVKGDPLILVDIFHSDTKVKRFSGAAPNPASYLGGASGYLMPKRVLACSLNGTVRYVNVPQGDPSARMFFSWNWIFLTINSDGRLTH